MSDKTSKYGKTTHNKDKGKPKGSASRPAKAHTPRQQEQPRNEQKCHEQRPGKEPNPNLICGRNAVLEALSSELSVNRVLIAEGLAGGFGVNVIKLCREQGVPYQIVPKTRLTQLAGPDNRGVACELAAFHYQELEVMLAAAAAQNEPPLLLLLDGLEDPHNLGAVIRTALCAGAHGVVIPKRRSAALNATVLKTSAGAASHLPVARVSNLAQTAEQLQKAGLWLAAADMGGQTAWQTDLRGPLALVLGSEGKGVSPILQKMCDLTVGLPLKGPVASLNVSAAAAALLYEICRQRSL